MSALKEGRRAQWTYVGLAVLVAVLWIATLPSRPLFDPDEGRYAEIPREMLAQGEWIIPHLNGLAYIEKPPLQYWATAAALRLLGQGELAARFYTALCALATLVVVWLTALRLWGRDAAWRAAAALSGMLLFVVLGQLLTLDMSLTFFMTSSLAAFLVAQASGAGEGESAREGVAGGGAARRRFMLAAWAAAALGVLTKGLIAAAIPGAVLVLYCLHARDFAPWRRLAAAPGLALFLAIAVPWHWLAARRLPDFAEFFFVHEHLARYFTPSADREEAWWFFAAVFVLGSLPWTYSALRVMCVNGRRPPRAEFDPVSFLWIWSAFIVIFFSLSDSKLIPYILPALPAIALLMGASPAEAWRRDLGVATAVTLLAAGALAAAAAYGPRFIAPTERNQYFVLLAGPLGEVSALLAVSGAFALVRRRDATHAAVFLGAGWCLSGLLLMRAAAVVAPIYSGVVLARALESVPPEAPIFSVATYDQSLPFYWRRTVTLVAYRGELDFGLRHDPRAEIPSVADFVGRWRDLPDGYAVMEKTMFDDLRNRGVPMREIARDVHRILVARR